MGAMCENEQIARNNRVGPISGQICIQWLAHTYKYHIYIYIKSYPYKKDPCIINTMYIFTYSMILWIDGRYVHQLYTQQTISFWGLCHTLQWSLCSGWFSRDFVWLGTGQAGIRSHRECSFCVLCLNFFIVIHVSGHWNSWFADSTKQYMWDPLLYIPIELSTLTPSIMRSCWEAGLQWNPPMWARLHCGDSAWLQLDEYNVSWQYGHVQVK